jgi:hypothetical protein
LLITTPDLDVHARHDHFQVQARRREFGGFEPGLRQAHQHRQHVIAQIVVVEPAITVRQEGTGLAVQRSHHAQFGLVVQPGVDVAIEQR